MFVDVKAAAAVGGGGEGREGEAGEGTARQGGGRAEGGEEGRVAAAARCGTDPWPRRRPATPQP